MVEFFVLNKFSYIALKACNEKTCVQRLIER